MVRANIRKLTLYAAGFGVLTTIVGYLAVAFTWAVLNDCLVWHWWAIFVIGGPLALWIGAGERTWRHYRRLHG